MFSSMVNNMLYILILICSWNLCAGGGDEIHAKTDPVGFIDAHLTPLSKRKSDEAHLDSSPDDKRTKREHIRYEYEERSSDSDSDEDADSSEGVGISAPLTVGITAGGSPELMPDPIGTRIQSSRSGNVCDAIQLKQEPDTKAALGDQPAGFVLLQPSLDSSIPTAEMPISEQSDDGQTQDANSIRIVNNSAFPDKKGSGSPDHVDVRENQNQPSGNRVIRPEPMRGFDAGEGPFWPYNPPSHARGANMQQPNHPENTIAPNSINGPEIMLEQPSMDNNVGSQGNQVVGYLCNLQIPVLLYPQDPNGQSNVAIAGAPMMYYRIPNHDAYYNQIPGVVYTMPLINQNNSTISYQSSSSYTSSYSQSGGMTSYDFSSSASTTANHIPPQA